MHHDVQDDCILGDRLVTKRWLLKSIFWLLVEGSLECECSRSKAEDVVGGEDEGGRKIAG